MVPGSPTADEAGGEAMAVITPARAVDVAPITAADVPRVAAFLHANMNDRVPVERWASAVELAVER